MPGKNEKKRSCSNKIVIITGANTGIGFETAKELANRGATVILACRDPVKAGEARDNIVQETQNERVIVLELDLASLESIRAFADTFKAKFDRLDVLINNAGLAGIPYSTTKDGFEKQFGVMHLGHFYLTSQLFDMLKKSAPSRVVTVASLAHLGATIKWDTFKSDKDYSPWGSYGQAKLANILFNMEFANRFKDTGITAVCLHPGFVQTDLFRTSRETRCVDLVFTPIMRMIAKSGKNGAKTSVYCAVEEKVTKHNGAYYVDCKVKKPYGEARNAETARKLWEVSEELLGIKFE